MGGVDDKELKSKYVEFKIHMKQLMEMTYEELKVKVVNVYFLETFALT